MTSKHMNYNVHVNLLLYSVCMHCKESHIASTTSLFDCVNIMLNKLYSTTRARFDGSERGS